MPRSATMTGSKWFTCDRCGFDYPVRYKRVQNGASVCTYIPCFDEVVNSDPLDVIELPDDELAELDFEVINDGF